MYHLPILYRMNKLGVVAKTARIIAEERDGEKASNYFNAFYEVRPARAAYNAFHQVRKLIYDNDCNRNKYYEDRVLAFIESHSDRLTEDDQAKLKKLLRSSLRYQNQVENGRYRFLSSQDLDIELRNIRSCIAPLYKFLLPVDVRTQALSILSTRRKSGKDREDRTEFKISKSQIDDIIEVARNRIKTYTITRRTNQYPELLMSLMILTGRRSVEVAMMTSFIKVENEPYQAIVTSLSKERFPDEGRSGTIPLLAPFDDIMNALKSVRDFKQFKSHRDFDRRACSLLPKASLRLFGIKLSHSLRRNIYLEASYSRREMENHFMIQDHAVVKRQWMSYALYLSPSKLTNLDFYSRIEVISSPDHNVV
jgi:hypothetical protein